MLGAHSGVAARLKELVATLVDHDSLCCTLLVLSLAACDTAHKFPWFSKFGNTLNQLYTHSLVCSAALAAVQKVLDASQLKLQKSTDTWWLSHENAVHAVRLTVDVFVLVLLSEAASEGNATALGLVIYLKKPTFVVTLFLCLMYSPSWVACLRHFRLETSTSLV